MTVRQDVLDAARRLVARGVDPFSPAQIVAEAKAGGSTYAERSLRTHVVSYMCGNAPGDQSGRWDDLVRVGPGRYRLADASDTAPSDKPAVGSRQSEPSDPRELWSWEGNVQAVVVRYLSADGWNITRVADTASREQGIDIEARRRTERLAVEVKGFPSTSYVRGPNRGQPKATSPTVQARHWFAMALLTATLLVDEDANRRVVIALPDASTYRSLADRTARARGAANIELWFVAEDGQVQPHA